MSFKKTLLATALLTATAAANAIPNLDIVTGQSMFAGIADTGAQSVSLIDTAGTYESAVARMLIENVGEESAFGIN